MGQSGASVNIQHVEAAQRTVKVAVLEPFKRLEGLHGVFVLDARV